MGDRADGPDAAGPRDEGFLARWSRLKRQARDPSGRTASRRPGEPSRADQDPPRAARVGEGGGAERPPAAASPRAEPTDADMPPVSSLDENSDYRGFLSPRVSEDLRRQALRRLFHLPQFNVRDGLTDYWEDLSHFEPLGDIVPHEMRAMLEREAQRLARPVEPATPGDPDRGGGEGEPARGAEVATAAPASGQPRALADIGRAGQPDPEDRGGGRAERAGGPGPGSDG